MTIDFEKLVDILMKESSWQGDTSPREALYVEFHSDERKVKDTISYHHTDGGLVAIDINEKGEVLGIEII